MTPERLADIFELQRHLADENLKLLAEVNLLTILLQQALACLRAQPPSPHSDPAKNPRVTAEWIEMRLKRKD